jgi:hypothetical protein
VQFIKIGSLLYEKTYSDIFSYLSEIFRNFVAMFPRRNPILAVVALQTTTAIVKYLAPPHIGAEHVRLPLQRLVEGFNHHRHCIVHQRRLSLNICNYRINRLCQKINIM